MLSHNSDFSFTHVVELGFYIIFNLLFFCFGFLCRVFLLLLRQCSPFASLPSLKWMEAACYHEAVCKIRLQPLFCKSDDINDRIKHLRMDIFISLTICIILSYLTPIQCPVSCLITLQHTPWTMATHALLEEK